MQNQKFDILVPFQIHRIENVQDNAFGSLELEGYHQYEINWAIYDIN